MGTRRLVTIYLIFAGAAIIAVFAAAWWSGRGTPDFEAGRLAYIEQRMLRQARDRLVTQLNELEYKVRSLAEEIPSSMGEKDPSLPGVLERSLGALDLEGIQLRRYGKEGELILDFPASAPQRFPKIKNEELSELMAWSRDAKNAHAIRFDVLQLPYRSDIQSRDVVRYSVACWKTGEGGLESPDGLLCLWFPSTLLLSSYLIPTHLLPESYSFALYWEHTENDTGSLPSILWHSAEPQWIRAEGEDASAFLQSLMKQTKILVESGEDAGIIDVPRRDGHSRKEVVALVPVVFGAKRWIVGLSTPYEIAVEFSAAQRNFMVLLTILTLAVLLVGVGLLFYQRTRIEVEASEQRRSQLRKMQYDYRELFSENPTAMLVFDDQSQLVDCNFSAERLLGLSREEGLGRRWSELFDEASVRPLWDSLRDRGHLYARDAQLLREGDGTPLLVEIWGRCIGDFWIVMAQNVAQRRELEQQLARVRRMDSVGSLASTLAHDFNNLLGQVQIMVSNLRTDLPAGSPFADDLAAIEKKVDDASEMVANLLASRENVVSSDPVILDPVLREFAVNQKKALPKNVELRLELRSDLPTVWITPHALRRVLDNLCLNACDAMPYGGSLALKAYGRVIEPPHDTQQLPAGSYSVLEISDTGVGMSRDVLDTIFEPFFTTKDKGKGTGLGLWTVYRIVRKLGGWIHVQSRPGNGTRFTIYLPQARFTEDEVQSRMIANAGGSPKLLPPIEGNTAAKPDSTLTKGAAS
ncbi:MAG: ATP-binding protein [Planctomycetota bacterium]